jgi:sensor histidine kinase regulating citrate/malate metabolism
MIKNALEACQPGQTVTVGCQQDGADVLFWVHNPTVMPLNVQLQMFQRSFSTKGQGRGLGTYSMKLLSERYLKGRVAFTSREGEGTRFTVVYPRSIQ